MEKYQNLICLTGRKMTMIPANAEMLKIITMMMMMMMMMMNI